MFKVGDLLKGIKDCENENMITGLLEAEVMEVLDNGNEVLLQITKHKDNNKVGIFFKFLNSKEYLELINRAKESISIEDVTGLVKNFYEKELSEKESMLKKINRDKKVARDRFILLVKQEEEMRIELEKAKTINMCKTEIAEKIFEELQTIEKDEKCENIEVEGKTIFVYTTQLYIEDENFPMGHFKINKYKIEINLDDLEVKVHGLLDEYKRESCWSCKCPHPHISNYGSPCWGNTEAMLIDTMANKEYYTTFMLVINFLETFNIEDEAGKNIKNWDFVSIENDERILSNPYSNIRKLDCGCEIDEDEDESVYYCSVCNDSVCNECVTSCECCGNDLCSEHYCYIDYNDEYVCPSCKEKYYVFAKDIGGYCKKEDTFICDKCEEEFTNDDINLIENESDETISYCSGCCKEESLE